jgi:collagenase-like PrtC family protease
MLLNLGSTFEVESLYIYGELNDRKEKEGSPDRISEVYGCTQELNTLGNARALDRLPSRTEEEVRTYIAKAKEFGIDVNWTINSPCLGDLNLFLRGRAWRYLFSRLIAIGVTRITVAHPLLLEIIQGEGWNFKVELSTIMGVQTLEQVKWLKNRYPFVDKICASLYRNRDFHWIRKMAKLCSGLGISLELLANEFCSIGGIPCEGLLRSSCYIASSHSRSSVPNEYGYPMGICTESRSMDPLSWIKAQFILPQWVVHYEMRGINNFKVTRKTQNLH